MKKDVKLYSAFFPFYGLLTLQFQDIPWMLLANVSLITGAIFLVLKICKTENWKGILKDSAGRAFATALLTDVIAVFLRFLPVMAEMLLRLLGFKTTAGFMAMYLSEQAWYQTWAGWNIFGMTYVPGCMLVVGVIASFLSYKWTMKKVVPDRKLRLWISVALAICSIPWGWLNTMW